MSRSLLSINGLSIGYSDVQSRSVAVISSVDLSLAAGETLGLVGESGCGKSTLLLAIMGFYKAGLHRLGGDLQFMGEDPGVMPAGDLQKLRGGRS